jgi:RND family efflux transporter MFP subunit
MNKGNFMMKKLLLSSCYLVLLSSCSEQQQVESEKTLRPVRTITVSAPDLNRAHEFTAVVDASRKADLSFKVSGELIKFNVNQGENVKSGQVIAKLNDRDIKVQLNEARSYFDKAKADFERAKDLISTRAISQADFDQLKSQFTSAKAKLDTAKNNLEYTELRASFTGIIAKKYTENFQEVRAGSGIVALHDLSNIDLKIDLPESIMIRVKRRDEPPKLTAQFDAIAGEDFPLSFKEVSTQADDVTKTYQVTLSMAAPSEHNILPGMTAHVTAEQLLQSNGSEARFYLPAKTVLKDSKGNYVYIITHESKGIGLVSRHSVTIGEITELGIEIFAGLKQGDEVLSAGMSKVSNGMKVRYQAR